MFENPLVRELAAFLDAIGIPARAACAIHPTLFPGLDIQNGHVLIDEERVIHPGDILHEAGHLAVTDPALRSASRLNPTGGEELGALAWSYAAAMHLKLDPSIVFYPSSYHDLGDNLIESFTDGRYVGVPLLQRYGMTSEPKNAREDMPPYPQMRRWLR